MCFTRERRTKHEPQNVRTTRQTYETAAAQVGEAEKGGGEEEMTAEQVRQAIRKKYNDHRRFAVAEEVGLTTGFSHRRLDMMVLDCYNSNGFRIDGFEIKVSTADLRRELTDPEKHIAFYDVIDYYTLAGPIGVADPLMDIIPKRWGILIVNGDGSTRYKRKPLALEDKTSKGNVPRGFLASIVRSIQERQPSEQELRNEYERGLKDGKAEEKRHLDYVSQRVQHEGKKLEEYDNLRVRLQLWSGDVEDALNQFEAFRNLKTEDLLWKIDGAIAGLKELEKCLRGSNARKEGKNE